MPGRQRDQLRRCVASVAGRGGTAEGDTSSAFAICTSSLQRGGYLEPGTAKPTAKGRARSRELSREMKHPIAIARYQDMLRRARRGSANRAPILTDFLHKETPLEQPATPQEAKRMLKPLREALDEVFACDTAFGDCHPDRPSAGQCFLASMMVQDMVGGEIVAGEVKNIPHYWVRVNGIDVDITGDQFFFPAVQAKKGQLYAGGRVFDREPREDITYPSNTKVMKLYRKLRKRLLPVLHTQGHDEIADLVGAMP